LGSHGYVLKLNKAIAIHFTNILKSIADIKDFSVKNLVNLMTSGFVKSEIVVKFSFVDLFDLGKNSSLT